MLNQIKEVIEQYEIICIYRHVFPDGDAKGSQFGLKTWIESKYPNKQVYAIGQDTPNSFFPNCYHGEVEFEKALAIIVDTANHQRIDGEGWNQCDKIIKIDHHPAIDQYGALNFVREEACAASEIIGEMFMEANEQLSKESATYLYCGLIADSQKFSIPTTTSKSLQVASYLIDFGVDEVEEDEEEVVLYGEFAQNSAIQKYLEENGYEITSSEFVRIPNDLKEVTAEQREAIEKLIEKLEEDEDVQNVFHNMKEDEEGEE